MMNKDKIKMDVMIAGIPISVNVPFEAQDEVRDTEKSIDDLYNNWKKRFPKKSVPTLLAMIAYQYASFYQQMLNNNRSTAERLSALTADIDAALADIDAPERPEKPEQPKEPS